MLGAPGFVQATAVHPIFNLAGRALHPVLTGVLVSATEPGGTPIDLTVAIDESRISAFDHGPMLNHRKPFAPP